MDAFRYALMSSYVMPQCDSAMLLVSSYEPARGCVAARCGSSQYPQFDPCSPQMVPSSSVVEHPTRSRRVVGSNSIWDSDFFRVYMSPRIYIISCCCYFSVSSEIRKVFFRFSFPNKYFVNLHLLTLLLPFLSD